MCNLSYVSYLRENPKHGLGAQLLPYLSIGFQFVPVRTSFDTYLGSQHSILRYDVDCMVDNVFILRMEVSRNYG